MNGQLLNSFEGLGQAPRPCLPLSIGVPWIEFWFAVSFAHWETSAMRQNHIPDVWVWDSRMSTHRRNNDSFCIEFIILIKLLSFLWDVYDNIILWDAYFYEIHIYLLSILIVGSLVFCSFVRIGYAAQILIFDKVRCCINGQKESVRYCASFWSLRAHRHYKKTSQ